jgi:hypothetical protein
MSEEDIEFLNYAKQNINTKEFRENEESIKRIVKIFDKYGVKDLWSELLKLPRENHESV